MKAIGTWRGGYRTELDDGRGHVITVDLPADDGGGDRGPSALELSVLSLAGCITTIFALVAERRHLEFSSLRVELAAHRPRGAPTITSVDGTFTLGTEASPVEVETALAITLRLCPVGVLWEHAKVPIHLRTEIRSPDRVRASSHHRVVRPGHAALA